MLRVLLGGARSGKSSLAIEIAGRPGRPVTFIATGEPLDAEFARRIEHHRAERPRTWQTIDEPTELETALAQPGDDSVAIIDCLTLWVSSGTDLAGRLGGSALGYLIDQLVGEPPDRLHPLRAFGHFMATIEQRIYRDDRFAGAGYAAVGLATGMLSGAALSSTTAAMYLSCGGRALAEVANLVDHSLRESDLVTARENIRALVGRDSEDLEEEELVRAVVESVAENTVDAIVAPLFFAAAMGASGALGYRAANTLDALVGYRSARYERFGWASAGLDDVLNYLPARLTALLVALARPRRAVEVLRAVRCDAPAHPSPNAGVAEAAFAAALGLRLGGESSYGGKAETRPFLGNGRVPERSDITRAVRLSSHVGAAAAIAALAASLGLRAKRRGYLRIGCQ